MNTLRSTHTALKALQGTANFLGFPATLMDLMEYFPNKEYPTGRVALDLLCGLGYLAAGGIAGSMANEVKAEIECQTSPIV